MPITQVITTLPDGPDPAGDPPAVFSQKAAASVLAQKKLVPELNTFATQLNATADKVNADAAVAATATAAAAAAMATANVTVWASGATVQQYAAVISPANARTYRRKTATGSGTADPSTDPTNYEIVSAVPTAYTLMASATVGAAVANIDFLNLFTSDCDKYVIEVTGLRPGARASLWMQFASGGVVNTSFTLALGTLPIFSGAGTGATVTIEVRNASSAAEKTVGCRGAYIGYRADGGTADTQINQESRCTLNVALSGFRLFVDSSTSIVAGTVRVYGIKNIM